MNDYGVEMVQVDSSSVDSLGYDEEQQQLYVRFVSGELYLYKGVGVMEFEGLRDAPSIGAYLNRSIKGTYPYEKIG